MRGKPTKQGQVLRVLQQRIHRGVYQGKLPGERALAAELGTNPKTVQLALTQLELLGVVRRVQRKGTFVLPPGELPGKGARIYARLILQTPMADLKGTHLWASIIIYAFQEAAHGHDVCLSLEYVADVDHIVETAVAQVALPEYMGVCLLALPLETRHIVALAASRGPVVVAESHVEEPLVPCVTFDNIGAGQLAAQHLVERGHRRIAFLQQEPASSSHRQRLRGIEDVLENFGLQLALKKTVSTLARQRAVRSVLDDPARVTGVICGNTLFAETVVEMAAGSGVPCPQRLSVVALAAAKADPEHRVTTIVMDHIGLGRRAFEMLLDEDLMAEPRRVLIPVKLSDGGTTGPAPAD